MSIEVRFLIRIFTVALVFLTSRTTLHAQCSSGSVTFRVDMRNESVDPLGVYFAGSFQGSVGQSDWTPTPMCDLGSGIWEITFCGVPTGGQTYKFLNGPGGWEFDAGAGGAGTPGPCNTGVGFNDREIVISGANQTVGPYCFNTCDILCSTPDPGGSDNISPTIVNVPNDVTIDCTSPLPFADCLMAMDNCFINCSTDLPVDDVSGLDACGFGDIVRSWTVMDQSGNSTTESQIITIQDNQEPIIDPSGIADITISCGSLSPGTNLPATDDCDLSISEAILTEDLSGLDACGTGLIIRTWNVSDCSGNDALPVVQQITIQDNDAPIIDASGIMDITVACDAVPPVINLPASDNCDASVSQALVFEDASAIDACGTGIILRTWDVSDCAGNAALTVNQQITVEDGVPPLIDGSMAADITVSCGMIPTPPTLSASDNCDASLTNPSMVEDNSGIDACGLGVLIRTWSISDCSGNAAVPHIQNITIVDGQGPVMTAPEDITISCEDPLPPLNAIAATDACDSGVSSSLAPSDDLSALDACNLGDIVRTWTASDCEGNTTVVSQRITVQDNGAPVFEEAIPADITISCLDPLPAPVDLLASDACDASIITSTFPSDNTNGLDPNGVGILIRSWEIVDCAGNITSAEQQITIEGIESEFTLLISYCVLDDTWYTLPIASDNGVLGFWNVIDFNPSILGEGIHTFVFNPNPGECGSPFTLEIEVGPGQVPNFELDTSFCVSDSTEYVLNTSSINGILGEWTIDRFIPADLGPGAFQSFFIPFDQTCTGEFEYNFSIDTLSMSTLPEIGPFCAQLQDTILLDSVSMNGISGTWNIDTIIPFMIGPDSLDLIFTPLEGQCALPDTQIVLISDAVEAQFSNLGPFCKTIDSTLILPDTSENRIAGIWLPASFNPSQITGSTFTSVFTPLDGQCASSQTISIDLEEVLEPVFPSFTPFCVQLDSNIVLPTISTNGIEGSWDLPIINPSLESEGSRSIRFTPNGNTCARSVEMMINFVNYDVQTEASLELCEGTNLVLSTSGDSAISYLWTGPNTFSSALLNPVISGVSPDQSGQYCVLAAFDGCSIEKCLEVTVFERPQLTVDSSQCFDNTYTLFISSNQDGSLVSNFGTVSSTGLNTFSIENIPNDQEVSLTLSANNSQACDTGQIIQAPQCSCLNPALITSFTASASQACLGDSIWFTATVGGGANSITWDYDDVNAEVQEEAFTLLFIPQNPGRYEVAIESNDPDGSEEACSPATGLLVVEVFDTPPPPQVTPDNLLFCKDSLAQELEAEGENLRWYDANLDFIGNTPPSPSTSSVGVTTYYVSQTTGFCESDFSTITVEVENCGCQNPVSILDLMIEMNEVCLGLPISVEVEIDNEDYLGFWSVLPLGAGSFLDPTALSTSFEATVAGNLQLVYTTGDPDGDGPLCASDQRIVNLFVVNNPPPPITDAVISLCQGDIASPITATGTNLLWYDENQNPIGAQAPTPGTTMTGIQVYYVSQEVNTCESDLVAIEVEVVNCDCVNPSQVVNVSVSKDTLCVFEEVLLNVEVTNNNFSGFWYLNGSESNAFQDVGAGQASFIPQEGGLQNIAYIIEDPDGDGPCEASSFSIEIFVDELRVDWQNDDVDCYENGGVYFDIESLLPYRILNVAGEIVSDSIEDLTSGTYTYFIQSGACSESLRIEISDTKEEEELQEQVFIVSGGDSLLLQPDIMLSEVDSFVWNTSQFLSDNSFSPLSSPEADIIYEIMMYQGGCLITQRFVIQVNKSRSSISAFLPNVFAPDGSGANATFGLVDGAPYSEVIDFKIWDRWGNLVYTITNSEVGKSHWDGRRAGKGIRTGVYIYRITAIHSDGAIESTQGDLLLMR
jgi:gliding motility-associated-like protein